MDDRLKAEIEKRMHAEKTAQEEIERLRRELEYMRSQPREVVVHQKPAEPKPRPKPQNTNNVISQQPLLDILQRLKTSVDKIAHGEGKNRVIKLKITSF